MQEYRRCVPLYTVYIPATVGKQLSLLLRKVNHAVLLGTGETELYTEIVVRNIPFSTVHLFFLAGVFFRQAEQPAASVPRRDVFATEERRMCPAPSTGCFSARRLRRHEKNLRRILTFRRTLVDVQIACYGTDCFLAGALCVCVCARTQGELMQGIYRRSC